MDGLGRIGSFEGGFCLEPKLRPRHRFRSNRSSCKGIRREEEIRGGRRSVRVFSVELDGGLDDSPERNVVSLCGMVIGISDDCEFSCNKSEWAAKKLIGMNSPPFERAEKAFWRTASIVVVIYKGSSDSRFRR